MVIGDDDSKLVKGFFKDKHDRFVTKIEELAEIKVLLEFEWQSHEKPI